MNSTQFGQELLAMAFNQQWSLEKFDHEVRGYQLWSTVEEAQLLNEYFKILLEVYQYGGVEQ